MLHDAADARSRSARRRCPLSHSQINLATLNQKAENWDRFGCAMEKVSGRGEQKTSNSCLLLLAFARREKKGEFNLIIGLMDETHVEIERTKSFFSVSSEEEKTINNNNNVAKL